MEEWNTATPNPNTVTVRRNPPRRARPTPYSTVPYPTTSSTQPSSRRQPIAENLKVFLRIRPLITQQTSGKNTKTGASRIKNAWPQNPSTKSAPRRKVTKKSEMCLKVNDSNSATLSPPESLKDLKRIKSEVYSGFSHVFSADSSQEEVYKQIVDPLVEDFMKGKSGMLAALGPSGSGKTHTVFGSQRLPGMVPLALRHIFSSSSETHPSRIFYLSMFEIYAEGAKSERIIDLSQGGGEPCLQQSTIKGLKETVVSDAQHAESLIALGMAKRNTAMTNTNSQSSRSQCIINIRSFCINLEGGVDGALLTIVDLAGAEREKKTGNQGARLLESNKINNTSMVFGLCLRSLLEHQKNPKKPLQKHFQNSLLTKYLRDYLEGKKRMALILTVKSGEEDYLDTSYLLRQASPYMQIKFGNDENKRQLQTFPRGENPKRMKPSSSEACEASEPNVEELCQFPEAEDHLDQVKVVKQTKKLAQAAICTTETKENIASDINDDDLVKKERQNQIMQGFAKALWNVLKQYKNNLEMAENEKECLRNSLSREKARRSELEEELNILKSCHGRSEEVVEEKSLVDDKSKSYHSSNVDLHKDRSRGTVLEVLEVEKDLGGEATCLNGELTGSEVLESPTRSSHVVMITSDTTPVSTEMNLVQNEEETDNSSPHHAEVLKEIADTQAEDISSTGQPQGSGVSKSAECEVTSRDDSSFAVEENHLEKHKDCSHGNVLEASEGMKDLGGEANCLNGELTGFEILESPTRSSQVVMISSDTSPASTERNLVQNEEATDNCSPHHAEDLQEIADTQTEDTSSTGQRQGSGVSKSAEYKVISSDDSSSLVEENHLEDQKPSEEVVKSKKDVTTNGLVCSAKKEAESDSQVKPKRRLLPASSLLLRNLNSFGFEDEDEDENVNRKGHRGEKKDLNKRTQGSISLKRLLDDLHL